MDDLFSKINEVLKNPEALDQIKNIASGLTSNNNFGNEASEAFADSGSSNFNSDKSFSLDSIQKMMQGSQSQSKNIALLNAITPYMRKERATKINSAIKAIQVLSLLNTLR